MALTALGFWLQVAAAAPPTALTVRSGDRVRQVPVVVAEGGGLALRADVLAEALGGQLVRDGARTARYRLNVGRIGVELETGTALAVIAADTLPLSGTVFRRAATLYVPLGLAADLLPRMGAGVMFDAAKQEIRRFAPVAAAKRAAPPVPTTSAPRSSPAISKPFGSRGARQHVVVVDAGHGGRDNGMSGPIGGGPRVYEKNITLAVSQQLQRALEERGIRVIMTRTTDTLIGLYDRGPIANAAKGDLFVSIHVNAANPRWQNPGGARGFETYFLAEAKTEDERRVAAMENEAVKFETNADVSRDDPLGFIMRDMAQNEHLRESMRLATLIQDGMRTVHPGPNRGVKQAGLAVLVTAFMPAVLVEIGFGTNRAEAGYITDPQRQSELADRLADAIERYLDEYERKVGG